MTSQRFSRIGRVLTVRRHENLGLVGEALWDFEAADEFSDDQEDAAVRDFLTEFSRTLTP